jgi:trehalose 6-phosphate phosphatase
MRDALKHVQEIEAQVQKNGCVVLLDYDGTLAPIRRHHARAHMLSRTHAILRALSKCYPTAIISGRMLEDVRARVRLPISYAGSHGLESHIAGSKKSVRVHLSRAAFKRFQLVRKKALDVARAYKGVRVEDKIVCLAFHYRALNKKTAQTFVAQMNRELRSHIRPGDVRVIDDLCTYDVIPDVRRTKGDAAKEFVRVLKKSQRAVGLYIGDSYTDEDAFKALQSGITIRVGRSPKSCAQYFVARRSGVDRILRRLATASSRL